MLTTALIVACLLAMPGRRSEGAWVVGALLDRTGFGSQAYACAVGVMPALFTLTAYDAPAHMAEETAHASQVGRGGGGAVCALGYGRCDLVYRGRRVWTWGLFVRRIERLRRASGGCVSPEESGQQSLIVPSPNPRPSDRRHSQSAPWSIVSAVVAAGVTGVVYIVVRA
jgi:hypothetical protein